MAGWGFKKTFFCSPSPVYLVFLCVCLSTQPWHLRTLQPFPTPQNRGTFSTGLETCLVILVITVSKIVILWFVVPETC